MAHSAAEGLALRFDLSDEQPLFAAILLLFLLVCGLALLRQIERRRMPLRMALGLPRRASAGEEWATGAALGWAGATASVLAIAPARGLNVELWTAPRAWELFGLSLATLLIGTLSTALALYGYGFQRLIQAIGPTRATLFLVLLGGAAASRVRTPMGTPDGVRLLVEMLAVLLLALCWHRTHGLWLGWGLHFAWAASTGVLFGLPLRGKLDFASVADTRVRGPLWLTGGSFGPGAAAFSILLLLAAIPILVRVTADYAWDYTHP
ncbi:MAG TPA: CPBP family intramembrane glutamate endopeptidase, partial [Acidobacteriaceae bacterium]|nr:CPBP family intramembrane glutamate endopeptidase [Acidobacteriaceae bacterium]